MAAPAWIFSFSTTGQVIATALVAAIVVAALADALRIPGARYVELARVFPPTIGVGDTRPGNYTLTSSWPAALSVSITQQVPAALAANILHAGSLEVTPGNALIANLTITGRSRGTFPLGPVALTIPGPWKLIRRSLIYYLDDTISITPSMANTGRYRLIAAQQRASV
jgi:uncharacterized protein (DUF58 family)